MLKLNDILDLIGRIFISIIFLFEAYDSFKYYNSTKEKIISYGLTWNPEFWLIISLIFLVIGGLFMLIGYRSKFAAFLLFLYWLPLTLIIYNFWAYDYGTELRRDNSIMFMKNIAICGGLLMIMVNGSGKYSIKRLLDRRRLKGEF